MYEHAQLLLKSGNTKAAQTTLKSLWEHAPHFGDPLGLAKEAGILTPPRLLLYYGSGIIFLIIVVTIIFFHALIPWSVIISALTDLIGVIWVVIMIAFFLSYLRSLK